MSEREESITRARAYVEHLFKARGQDVPRLPACCIIAHSDVMVEAARLGVPCQTFDLGSRRSCELHVLRTPAGSFAMASASAGAPMTALLIEELLALGARAFLSVGPAGGLSGAQGDKLAPGAVVVVDAALVCEGTSRHYGSTGGIERPDAAMNAALADALRRHALPFSRATTASTDALYRETPSFLRQIAKRGASAIDMEASALFSSCRFHGAAAAAVLLISDSVGQDETWSIALTDDRLARAESSVLPALVELACTWN